MLNRRKLKLGVLILSVLAIVALAGCSGDKTEKTQDGKQVIRVGYFPNLTHAQALAGFGDGTFQKAMGSEVTIQEHIFNAGPTEIEALLAGEIDLGYIGPVPAINGFVKSKGGLRIISGAADAGAVLIARKGAGIEKVKDLDGKRVAVPQLGNTQDISLRNLLSQANLKDASKGGTVTVIPAENPDILTLISKGEVDAALVPEPWGSRIVKETGARVVLDAKEVWRDGKYSTAVVIASSKFLKEHPDLVEKWLKAHVEITERIGKDPKASQVVINSQIKKLTGKSLPPDVLNNAFRRIAVTYNPEIESVNEFVRISVENKYLKETPDISNLFDLSLINKILAEKKLTELR
ncbi:aliphatic sulfonate ABC transporter substrate-binding protein [Thermincola potens]|uniref:Aliphatic sulfonates family ABC transporter, periplasmic ligand-binding protein n=1 Tax=Thermincola potens (strain JR) TaxID=635013 RepID=D5X9W3_THEPJ|nr:aliphatic sulfonate ABC transporter substrate-binding protein [Thermincola potens]ADG83096.1 aliphatic sulfonates family ABC transporter, periplasmic ligand-binding protein [Thermincola potens JR]